MKTAKKIAGTSAKSEISDFIRYLTKFLCNWRMIAINAGLCVFAIGVGEIAFLFEEGAHITVGESAKAVGIITSVWIGVSYWYDQWKKQLDRNEAEFNEALKIHEENQRYETELRLLKDAVKIMCAELNIRNADGSAPSSTNDLVKALEGLHTPGRLRNSASVHVIKG